MRLALRLSEFAASVGVDDETARRWCAAGKVPARKIDGAWLVSVKAFERLLDSANEEEEERRGVTTSAHRPRTAALP